jgi:hypothetical protein
MFNPATLAHFTGSEKLYHNPMVPKFKYTEGIKFLNDGANWLIVAILSHLKLTIACQNQDFMVATLTVKPNKSATLKFDDGNGNILTTQKIPYTDFPIKSIKFYIEYNTIMLPSER